MNQGADMVADLASSRYRHSAFANCICLGVWQLGPNSSGLATRKTAHRARDVATFRRFRL